MDGRRTGRHDSAGTAVGASGPHGAELAAPLTEQIARVARGEVSSEELTRMCLERIEALDSGSGVNAFIRTRGDQVIDEARTMDTLRASGARLGPLHGIPIAVKDNIWTEGTATSAGTAVLENFVPREDAAAVAALRRAGALVLGKTNLHEWCLGISNDNPHFGPVRNPYDPGRIAGGSSGGSCAAVAAGLAPAAIGTDTGGSIRIPAALCGAVGLKPTRGRTSRAGVFGLSWTCDVVGPITRTVADAALLTRILTTGPDPGDPAAPATPPPIRTGDLPADPSLLRGLRIGVPTGYFDTDNAPDIDRAIARLHALLTSAGAILDPVSIKGVERSVEIGTLTVLSEAIGQIDRALDRAGVGGGIEANLPSFGEDVRAALGTQVGHAAQPFPAHRYARAIGETIPAIRRSILRALDDIDVLLTPTTPAAAPPIDESRRFHHNGRELDTFSTFVRDTSAASITGLPALSLPLGFDSHGLPIGLQLIGAPWSEPSLIEIACAIEQLTP